MSFSPLSPLNLVVGISGGLDSTVLLHLMHRLQQRLPQLFSLSAIHVHHGLQPAADAFKAQAEQLTHALGVPLEVIHLAIPDHDLAALGVEAAARRHREPDGAAAAGADGLRGGAARLASFRGALRTARRAGAAPGALRRRCAGALSDPGASAVAVPRSSA